MKRLAELIKQEDYGINKFYYLKVYPPVAYRIVKGVPEYTDFITISETYYHGGSLVTIAQTSESYGYYSFLGQLSGHDWKKLLLDLSYELIGNEQ